MLRVLLELWPVTLPTAIYLVWHALQHLRKRARGEVHHPLKEGPWLRIALMTLAIAIVCALMLGLSQPKDKGVYTPATLHDGKVIDGRVAH